MSMGRSARGIRPIAFPAGGFSEKEGVHEMGSFRAPSRSTQAVEQQRLAGDLPADWC